MSEEVFYRVKLASNEEEHKEFQLSTLRRGFSLKKVLVIEGGAFLAALMFGVMEVLNERHLSVLSVLFIPLSVFIIHLWMVLWWILANIMSSWQTKNVKTDPDAQVWFFSECFRMKGYGKIQDLYYSGITRVWETTRSFLVIHNNRIFVLFKKNFIEGDPDTFRDFLKKPGMKPDYSREITAPEERPVHSTVMFQAGAVLNEEVCVRNGALERGIFFENMNALNFWGGNLGRVIMLLPILAVLCLALSLRTDDRLDGIVMCAVFLLGLVWFLVRLVFLWKRHGIDYAEYRRTAMRQYQQAMRNASPLEPVSCSFYTDSFEVTMGRDCCTYEYTAICRMYQTEWYLILMVESMALPLDKRSLGEDCQKLMDFLKEKCGLEWQDSPV